MNSYRDVDLTKLPYFLLASINDLLRKEGKWSDDKDDYPTAYGIRQATADFAGYKGKLRDLTRIDASKIWAYHWHYEPRFDLIARVSIAICNQVTDTSGPAGRVMGVKHLQRAMNHFNGPDYPYGLDLKVDGFMGVKTALMLDAFLGDRGIEGERILFCNINSQQECHFMHVTKRNVAKRRFSYGWSRGRVFEDLKRLFEGKTSIDNPIQYQET